MSRASKIIAALSLIVALYCGDDPFGHRPMARFPGFEVYPVDMPPWRGLPTARDPENRLQRAEVRFLNQVQGPESVVFDRHGRGPYTGIADGRIVFWNGTSWTDFAYTSPNRSKNPNGVSLSKDQSFVVFAEGIRGRLSRYWLKGEKAGTSEVFVVMPGHPDNVRTNAEGEFWVAIHCRRTLFTHAFYSMRPRLRKFLLKLPIKASCIYARIVGGRHHGMILKYSPGGELLQVLEDREGRVARTVSEVEEHDGKLWLGSVLMPFIVVYDLK